MDYLEAIVDIKNIIDPTFIDKIIPFINKKSKTDMAVRTSVRKDIRNVKGYHLNDHTPTNMFYWQFVKKEIERLHVYYQAKFPKICNSQINQIDLLKYKPGGKYDSHVDHSTNSSRHLSVIMNLNDEYEGGELIFTDQRDKEIKKLKLGKGSVVFFPSNFMYPHGIQPIKKGTRYSIVAWLQ
tara:strand:- start:994 stop:1539 length:546 start_codon:yes stop_codon:yes gene_type:complete